MNNLFFKNKIGRPSNETIKKRKIIMALLILIVLSIISVGAYSTCQYFKNNNFSSEEKNASTSSEKAKIVATKVDGSKYVSNTWATGVKLTASLKGKVPGTTKYTWYKDKKVYKDCTKATCTISTTQSGSFMVEIWNARKTYTSSSIAVKVDSNKIDSLRIYSNNGFSKGYIGVDIEPYKSVSGYKYQWYRNGSKISGATGDSYVTKKSGSYTVKVITGAGATKSKTVDVCLLDLSTGTTTDVWSNSNVTLKFTAASCPIKKYEWYKDDKLYSACKGKSECKITTNQNSTYCLKITSKNGQVFSDCEKVKIDKNKYSADLYSGTKKITSIGGNSFSVKKGTKLTIKTSDTLFCSKYEKAYKYYWLYSSTTSFSWGEDVVSTSKTYTPTKKGRYIVSVEGCNWGHLQSSFTVK